MARPSRYSADFRARAMRLVAEARPEHDTEWAVIASVAPKLEGDTRTCDNFAARSARGGESTALVLTLTTE